MLYIDEIIRVAAMAFALCGAFGAVGASASNSRRDGLIASDKATGALPGATKITSNRQKADHQGV